MGIPCGSCVAHSALLSLKEEIPTIAATLRSKFPSWGTIVGSLEPHLDNTRSLFGVYLPSSYQATLFLLVVDLQCIPFQSLSHILVRYFFGFDSGGCDGWHPCLFCFGIPRIFSGLVGKQCVPFITG